MNCFDVGGCEKTVCRSFTVAVPVTVKPFAVPEEPKVKCTGDMEIAVGHTPCESKDNIFKFTVKQNLEVEIPVKCGAEVCYGNTCAEDKGKCEEPPTGGGDIIDEKKTPAMQVTQ
jgi:hypothetical protein